MNNQKTLTRSIDIPKKTSSDRKKNKKETVAVIGLGYVGLPLAILAETRGCRVFGIDTDKEKVDSLRQKVAPHLSEKEKQQFRKSKFHISDKGIYLSEADIVLVCVPTPVYEDHSPNLEPIKKACEYVASALREGQLVIIESTINPGVCEEVLIPILESRSGLTVGSDFFFAHCPERINPGDERFKLSSITRVIGANDTESLQRGVAFYESILDAKVHPMQSLKEAEAVKVVENSFRDINIAFVNELAMSFDKLGIDVINVINGSATKPFAFMPHFPGCGVGGHCIPVDPYYLISYAAKNGFKHRFLSIAREINNTMPEYTVNLLESALLKENHSLRGLPIALLGLSYKRDIPDVRESPAIDIRYELFRRGAQVRTFDPFLPKLSSAKNLEEALIGVKGVIIATDHSAFRTLTPEVFIREGIPVIIDGRNCLPKERFVASGLTYKGIGR